MLSRNLDILGLCEAGREVERSDRSMARVQLTWHALPRLWHAFDFSEIGSRGVLWEPDLAQKSNSHNTLIRIATGVIDDDDDETRWYCICIYTTDFLVSSSRSMLDDV